MQTDRRCGTCKHITPHKHSGFVCGHPLAGEALVGPAPWPAAQPRGYSGIVTLHSGAMCLTWEPDHAD